MRRLKNALLKYKPKLYVSLLWVCSSVNMCESSGVVAPSLVHRHIDPIGASRRFLVMPGAYSLGLLMLELMREKREILTSTALDARAKSDCE